MRIRIGQTLNGRTASLRLAHHLHDLRKQRFSPDAFSADDKRTGGVDRSTGDGIAHLLLDRYRLARHHRLINRTMAFEDRAVDRDLSPGRTRSCFRCRRARAEYRFAAVVLNETRSLGRQT